MSNQKDSDTANPQPDSNKSPVNPFIHDPSNPVPVKSWKSILIFMLLYVAVMWIFIFQISNISG